jgi:PTS system galactitol-specific IIA component
MLEFDAGLACWDLEAADAGSVITHLAARLAARGCVGGEYGAQTLAREHQHPTGLPTRPFCIAFPHAEPEGVARSALAVAALRRPVTFKNMADPDEDLAVEIVFLLANGQPEEQIGTLRQLAELFGQAEKLAALRAQPNAAQAAAWLKVELALD